jgi:glucose-6-phosphate 1-dehydrogenase
MNENHAVQTGPAILVIFGITGDLSRRYLLPSLYHLLKNGLLDQKTRIVGVTRGDTSNVQLFEKLEKQLADEPSYDNDTLKALRERTDMFRMDLDQPADYERLLEKLNQIEDADGLCLNRLYYLSIPPNAYESVISLLGESGHNQGCSHDQAVSRLLVEKPFGYDLASAQQLIDTTDKYFDEKQVFRIDHYMAKETVQNMLTFRFHNPIFGALWNNQHIDQIEISAREKIDIEGRATFYESMGALRDIIQSHLIQILGIVTMDRPEELDSQQIHAKKQAVLDQVKAVDDSKLNAVRGQYKGYREEVDNDTSTTETYAAITVEIDNDRWRGVPIKLMTGKALDERKTEIDVNFFGKEGITNNKLRIRIQPDEGVELGLQTKIPGYTYDVQTTNMEFLYRNDFGDNSQPNAYERVLVDAIRGSHTLFATSREVLASWRIVQPILDAWAANGDGLIIYQPGAKNPEQSA